MTIFILSIDVGTSSEIVNGQIKVKSGVPVQNYISDGLLLKDQSNIEADVVVLATGYDHDYRNQVADITGWNIASQLGDFWGIDKNGDLRGVMAPVCKG